MKENLEGESYCSLAPNEIGGESPREISENGDGGGGNWGPEVRFLPRGLFQLGERSPLLGAETGCKKSVFLPEGFPMKSPLGDPTRGKGFLSGHSFGSPLHFSHL